MRAGWTRCIVLSLALASAPTCQSANAEEPAGTHAPEDIFFQDVPVVLSATRLSQPVSESPAAITVIDRELIEASGAIDIPDLFKVVAEGVETEEQLALLRRYGCDAIQGHVFGPAMAHDQLLTCIHSQKHLS